MPPNPATSASGCGGVTASGAPIDGPTGCVFIWRRAQNGTWIYQTVLSPARSAKALVQYTDSSQARERFGWSVALSGHTVRNAADVYECLLPVCQNGKGYTSV